MTSEYIEGRWTAGIPARVCMAVLAGLFLGLLSATSALGAYEQVGNFAGTPGVLHEFKYHFEEIEPLWPEEVQLGGVGGMAVNYTGAGGVPAGTIYAAGREVVEEERVARYNPDGSFSEAWSVQAGPSSERCGPEGDPTQPNCLNRPTSSHYTVDVDVDQSTGDVYALSENNTGTSQPLIHVYSADGAKVIAEFGASGKSQETIAESPEKIHNVNGAGAIAVNGEGDVYVADRDGVQKSRLMEFVPQAPGDYEHYVYAGQSHDLNSSAYLEDPVVDSAGFIYAISEFKEIEKLDPGQPDAGPVCEFPVPSGGLVAITVDPSSGEVFFFSPHDGEVHQLKPCTGGVFSEAGASSLDPHRQEVNGLAFDPVRRFAPGRPPGVLYLGADTGDGGGTEGEYPTRKVESSLGYIFARPLELPPAVVSESASHIGPGAAVLSARVNPEGNATRYAFEVVTQAKYEENEATEPFSGAVEAPVGGGFVGEGKSVVNMSASLSGLAPNTAYRYRVIATSNCSVGEPEKVCDAEGEAVGFRTFPPVVSGLPDSRVYEMVSPPQKSGGQVIPANPGVGSCEAGACKPGSRSQRFPVQVEQDGNAIAYEALSLSGESGPVSANEYLARRDPQAGWQNVNPTPSLLEKGSTGYDLFSPELTTGVFEQETMALSDEAPNEYSNFYTQPTGDPSALTPLMTNAPPHRHNSVSDAEPFHVSYVGASADLSRVFFMANDALTQEVPGVAPAAVDGGANEYNLYEWSKGQLSLVNVLPGNASTQPTLSAIASPAAHPVSSDGRRVFFADEAGHLYVREDGQTTREIETNGVPDTARFAVAAADGSKVLLANGHLHDLGEEELTVDLTGGQGGFQGVAGQSEDLSHIYFVDTKVLTGAEENEDCSIVAGEKVCEKATEGRDNLYSWTEQKGTEFIATLTAGDKIEQFGREADDWSIAGPQYLTAQASPDGRFFAFLAPEYLTGDNVGPCGQANGVGRESDACREVFLYDSDSGRLACPSCNRTGVAPLGGALLARIPDQRERLPLPSYLSDQGRLFFDSEDSLVPADTNGGVEDVYEYEPDGLGSCREAPGCVFLISGGTGTFDSNFLDMDPSGTNAFFTTTDRLSPRDTDELYDLYDARIEGGLASETESLTSECHGEACQSPASPAPLTTPSSVSFVGAGNVVTPAPAAAKAGNKPKAKRCAKGRRRVRGLCVRQRRGRGASVRGHRSVTVRHGGGAK